MLHTVFLPAFVLLFTLLLVLWTCPDTCSIDVNAKTDIITDGLVASSTFIDVL